MVRLAEGCGDVRPERTGPRQSVALVLEIVAHHDGLGPEPTSDRPQGLRLEPSFRKAPLECVEQVGRGCTALGYQFTSEVRAIDQPWQDRIDGASPAVCREIRCGQFVDASVAARCGQPVGQLALVSRQALVAQERRGERSSGEPREQLQPDQGHRPDRREQVPPRGRPAAYLCPQPLAARCQPERQRQDHERGRPWGRAQREPSGALGGEPFEEPAIRRRVVQRGSAGTDRQPDEQEGRSAGPADERTQEPQQTERCDHEPEADHRRVVDVRQRRSHPGVEAVTSVEEPVAESPHELGRGAGAADGLIGLGVLEDRQAERALDSQRDDPPDRHRRAQHCDAGGTGRGCHGTHSTAGGIRDEPDDRPDAGQHEGGRIDTADECDDHGELRRRPPRSRPCSFRCEQDHPGQRCPRSEDHRQSGEIAEQVRAEPVRKGRNQRCERSPTQPAHQPIHPECGSEHEGAPEQTLGEPVGDPDRVHQPVEGPDREQVPDVLVGDGAGTDRGIPHRRRLSEQRAGIEREVALGVRAHPAGRRQQHRDVGSNGEQESHRAVLVLRDPAETGANEAMHRRERTADIVRSR